MSDTSTKGDNMSDPFMPGNERRRGFDGPIAFGRMQIGMTDTGRRDLHENLSTSHIWHGRFFDDQRLAKGADHCRLHGFLHDVSPHVVL